MSLQHVVDAPKPVPPRVVGKTVMGVGEGGLECVIEIVIDNGLQFDALACEALKHGCL